MIVTLDSFSHYKFKKTGKIVILIENDHSRDEEGIDTFEIGDLVQFSYSESFFIKITEDILDKEYCGDDMKYLGKHISKLSFSELEWSMSTPLSRLKKCGQCPYCGKLEVQKHDEECVFLEPDISLKKIKIAIGIR